MLEPIVYLCQFQKFFYENLKALANFFNKNPLYPIAMDLLYFQSRKFTKRKILVKISIFLMRQISAIFPKKLRFNIIKGFFTFLNDLNLSYFDEIR